MDPGLSPIGPEQVRTLLAGVDTGRNSRTAESLLLSTLGYITDQPDPLDLKIAAAVVAEMREAARTFAPYRETPKVTVFGSARTKLGDPLYQHAYQIAHDLASVGWMVVTGAGPGIMQAAMEGAGRENSFGVSIRLPFEQGANPVIAGDEKYVSMKYFFTRKLMLVKESRAFVCLPGGFGTLDETFELLTLTQTGKGLPAPIVLLDLPGDDYWKTVHAFVTEQLVTRGLVSEADTGLYVLTDSCATASDEITRFYSNYDSIRYVGDHLVIRLRQSPSDEQIDELNASFGHLVSSGRIARVDPFPEEIRHDDHVGRPRIGFEFVKHRSGDLRAMINMLNGFTPQASSPPPEEPSSS